MSAVTVSIPFIPSMSLAEVGHVLAMARASDIFPGLDPNARMREIKSWLKSKGVWDFESVSLLRSVDKGRTPGCYALSNTRPQETLAEIEKLADALNTSKSLFSIRKAIVKGRVYLAERF